MKTMLTCLSIAVLCEMLSCYSYAETAIHGDLLYVSKHPLNKEEVMLVSGNKPALNLTKNTARDVVPDISPDGSTIAFLSTRDKAGSIYLCDRLGGNLRKITENCYHSYPEYSPDGKLLMVHRALGNQTVLVIMKIDGSEAKVLNMQPEKNIFSSRWSPNSKMIAYTVFDETESFLKIAYADGQRSKTICSIKSDSLTMPDGRRLTLDKRIGACSRSPDGTKIAYVKSSQTKKNQIRLVTYNGLEDRLLLESDYPAQSLEWSRNGERILYSQATEFNISIDKRTQKQTIDGAVQVFTIDTKGNVSQITRQPGIHNRPIWINNDSCIAFKYVPSLDSGNDDLFIMNLKDKRRRLIASNVCEKSEVRYLPRTESQIEQEH